MGEAIWIYALGISLSQPRANAHRRQGRLRRLMRLRSTGSREDTRRPTRSSRASSAH
jgi:hypothetical protein